MSWYHYSVQVHLKYEGEERTVAGVGGDYDDDDDHYEDDDDDEGNTRRIGYWLKCEAQFVKYLNGVTLQSQQETHQSKISDIK